MSKHRALVVDDIADAADSMAALLHLCGFDTDAQLGGEAALVSARSQRPDIVLLDLRMPRMGGFEFLRRLREVEGCAHIPVVIISGFHIAESREHALDLGVAHFFTKPVEQNQLLKRMNELLAAQQRRCSTTAAYSQCAELTQRTCPARRSSAMVRPAVALLVASSTIFAPLNTASVGCSR